jgi:hypothetical protein
LPNFTIENGPHNLFVEFDLVLELCDYKRKLICGTPQVSPYADVANVTGDDI